MTNSYSSFNDKQKNSSSKSLDIPKKTNVFIHHNDEQQKHSKNEDSYTKQNPNSYLSLIYEKLNSLELKIDKLLQKRTDKYSKEDLERCYKLIETNAYITTGTITNDPLLSEKYEYQQYKNTLLDYLLKEYPDLEQIKRGQGKKRYVFKKENKPAILYIVRSKKIKTSEKAKQSLYDEIKSHFSKLSFDKESISVTESHEILRKEFLVKQGANRRQILQDLIADNILQKPRNARFPFSNSLKEV
jgi:hypothetical protein